MSLLNNFDSACIIADDEDEVNVAKFNPIPGLGAVYGTKKGKLKVIKRAAVG